MSGHFTDEEMSVFLKLKERINECGGDDLQFFQSAYFARYNKHHDCVVAIAQYRMHAVVPQYVKDFL
jgi:hypothetical protein